jgi:hypothetical protein
MIKKILAALVFLSQANSVIAAELEGKVAPKATEFRVGEENPSLKIQATPLAAKTDDLIHFSELKCDVNWDQWCESDKTIEAPPGYQVCKALYSLHTEMGNTSKSATPTNWYTNDPENPDRFRAIRFYIKAQGSGFVWDKWGSNITLLNVGIRVIRADANNQERYEAGCDMPPH